MRPSSIRLYTLIALIVGGLLLRYSDKAEQRSRKMAELQTDYADGDWTQLKLEKSVREKMAQLRRSMELNALLEPDPEIEERLQKMLQSKTDPKSWVKSMNDTNSEAIIDWLSVLNAPTRQDLVDLLVENVNNHHELTTHLTLVMPPSKDAQGLYLALLATSHREKTFTPEALSEVKKQVLQVQCTFCKNKTRWMPANRHLGSYLQSCDQCGNLFAMVATDNRGDYRYANEFLTGYSPPVIYPTQMTKQEELYKIWLTVWEQTTYVRDDRKLELRRDCWQPSHETMFRGTGDCEDSSFLLADWLITRGFDARVAMGSVNFGEGTEGHAWVVVRIDGLDYLLEATAKPKKPPHHPPYVSDTLQKYAPLWVIDREAIYALRKGAKFAGSYWGSEWLRIPSRKRPESLCWKPSEFDLSLPPNKGRPVQMLKPILPDSWAAQRKSPILSNFKRLDKNDPVWQLK
jgi:predicted transglutaminase-like cysteine proteinase